jgi:hypothetical protein
MVALIKYPGFTSMLHNVFLVELRLYTLTYNLVELCKTGLFEVENANSFLLKEIGFFEIICLKMLRLDSQLSDKLLAHFLLYFDFDEDFL